MIIDKRIRVHITEAEIQQAIIDLITNEDVGVVVQADTIRFWDKDGLEIYPTRASAETLDPGKNP